ncbi:MAG: sigma-70 family RNA polymerase sigma factor [Myxococcales bacterium]|nr:sigma-70 family RNA polymerase sigma factor [Myxococcales bacterium]
MTRAERKLVRRLKERDERAFFEVIESNGDRVFNLCFRLLGNREEAEDLAQEVFIKVFKKIDTFEGDCKLSTWIYRIASNESKNRIRHLAVRHDKSKDEFDEGVGGCAAAGAYTAPAQMKSPDVHVEVQQLESIMQGAIAELEEDHRVLIVLRDIEELSYEEICSITELAEGTVKSRLHRARLALRKKMMTRM